MNDRPDPNSVAMPAPTSWLSAPMPSSPQRSDAVVGAGGVNLGGAGGGHGLPTQAQMFPDMLGNFTDHDPSLAWFMPFNVEPPDVHMDIVQSSTGQDQFPAMLGDENDMSVMPPGMFYTGM